MKRIEDFLITGLINEEGPDGTDTTEQDWLDSLKSGKTGAADPDAVARIPAKEDEGFDEPSYADPEYRKYFRKKSRGDAVQIKTPQQIKQEKDAYNAMTPEQKARQNLTRYREERIVTNARALKNMSANYDELSTADKSRLNFLKHEIEYFKQKGDKNFENDLMGELGGYGEEHQQKLRSALGMSSDTLQSEISKEYRQKEEAFKKSVEKSEKEYLSDKKIPGTTITYGEWKQKYGHDFDASNPEDRKMAQIGHSPFSADRWSPQAQETYRTAVEFNKGWKEWSDDLARRQGEAERAYDRSALELARFRNDPEYRKQTVKRETEEMMNSPEFQDYMASEKAKSEAAIKRTKELAAQGREQALKDQTKSYTDAIQRDVSRSGMRSIQEPEPPMGPPSPQKSLVGAALDSAAQQAMDVAGRVKNAMKTQMAQTIPTTQREKLYGGPEATGALPDTDVQRGQFPLDMYTDMEKMTGIEDPSIKSRIELEEPVSAPGLRDPLAYLKLFGTEGPLSKKFSRREEAPPDLSDYTSGKKYAVPGSVVWGQLSQHEKAQMARRALERDESHLFGAPRQKTEGGFLGIGAKKTGRYSEEEEAGTDGMSVNTNLKRTPAEWGQYGNMTLGQYLNKIMDEDEGEGKKPAIVTKAEQEIAAPPMAPQTQQRRFNRQSSIPLTAAELLNRYSKKYSKKSEMPAEEPAREQEVSRTTTVLPPTAQTSEIGDVAVRTAPETAYQISLRRQAEAMADADMAINASEFRNLSAKARSDIRRGKVDLYYRRMLEMTPK